MSIVAKVGERTYEFETFREITLAREIYAKCVGDQNDFETEMESAGIDVIYDLGDL